MRPSLALSSRRRVHLCTRRSRRGHLWPTRVKADAWMTWPTRASLTRAIGRRAHDVATRASSWTRARRGDAGILLDARKEADARILPRAYDVATRASFEARVDAGIFLDARILNCALAHGDVGVWGLLLCTLVQCR